jgi:hypothetical protein
VFLGLVSVQCFVETCLLHCHPSFGHCNV